MVTGPDSPHLQPGQARVPHINGCEAIVDGRALALRNLPHSGTSRAATAGLVGAASAVARSHCSGPTNPWLEDPQPHPLKALIPIPGQRQGPPLGSV